MNRRNSSIINGKKGGRPSAEPEKSVKLPDFEFVFLTSAQYNTLLDKYGYSLVHKALSILENWMKSSPQGEKYRGKNNYAHFRSDGWVINAAKKWNQQLTQQI